MSDAAIETVTSTDECSILYSDRGVQYRWLGWLLRISDAKLVQSMFRKAYSPDNAACECFFGKPKTKLFYHRDCWSTALKQFVKCVDAYIRWHSEKRIKISLSSIEYRESLGLVP